MSWIRKTVLLILLLCSSIPASLYAQFPLRDSLHNFSPLLYASYNYSQVISGDVLPSNGINFSLGLNAGRIFETKFVLGIAVDVRFWRLLGSNNKYDYLKDDVNKYIISDQNNAVDSARVSLLQEAFNDNANKYFWRSYLKRFGIMFSPYPDSYGSFMLLLKRGNYNLPIEGTYGNKHLNNGESEFIDFVVPLDYHIQLTCKPFTLFNWKHEKKFANFIRNYFLLSIYYEKLNLSKARLDGEKLTRYLQSDFFEKYKNSAHIGINISVGFY